LPFLAALSENGAPLPLARWARGMLLDGLYVDELRRALAVAVEEEEPRGAKGSRPTEEP
jgi:hypothetical protein